MCASFMGANKNTHNQCAKVSCAQIQCAQSRTTLSQQFLLHAGWNYERACVCARVTKHPDCVLRTVGLRMMNRA